jgi:hypothetical protein
MKTTVAVVVERALVIKSVRMVNVKVVIAEALVKIAMTVATANQAITVKVAYAVWKIKSIVATRIMIRYVITVVVVSITKKAQAVNSIIVDRTLLKMSMRMLRMVVLMFTPGMELTTSSSMNHF